MAHHFSIRCLAKNRQPAYSKDIHQCLLLNKFNCFLINLHSVAIPGLYLKSFHNSPVFFRTRFVRPLQSLFDRGKPHRSFLWQKGQILFDRLLESRNNRFEIGLQLFPDSGRFFDFSLCLLNQGLLGNQSLFSLKLHLLKMLFICLQWPVAGH